jgi:hypothetical protein
VKPTLEDCQADLFSSADRDPAADDDDTDDAIDGAVAPAKPEGDEQPDYDAAAPVEPTAPYRGAWKDEAGMCSASCPALRAVPGFSRPFTDCMVTGYRVEPGMWPCEIRSIYEAVKRGPA